MKISKEGSKIIAISGVVLLALWLLIFYMLKANDLTWLLITLAALLLEKEVIFADDLERIFGPRTVA